MIQGYGEGVLLTLVTTFGAVTLAVGRFLYGILRDILKETREERDYWRDKVDPDFHRRDE